MSIQKYFSILAIGVLSLSASVTASAQIVGVTKFVKQANVKVYVTTYAAEADVIVFKTPFLKNSTGNKGWWYFSTIDGEINKRICYVAGKEIADLVVYYTNDKNEAGWKNRKKRYMME